MLPVFVRKHMKECGFYDRTRIATKLEDGRLAIPINNSFIEQNGSSFSTESAVFCYIPYSLHKVDLLPKRIPPGSAPHQEIIAGMRRLCGKFGIDWSKELEDDLPRKWERHGDMLVLPENCFQYSSWKTLGE